jgi:hypothetical protein
MAELPSGVGPNDPLGGMGGGEGAPKYPNPENQAETIRRYNEVSIDRLPVGAERIISLLQSTEIGEDGDVTSLRKAIDVALAYREGLTLGPSGRAYEFEPHDTTNKSNKLIIANLERMFTTVEGSINRPGTATPYINAALENALDGRIQRAQEYHNDPVTWQTTIRMRLEQQNQGLMGVGKKKKVLDDEKIQQIVSEASNRAEREFAAIPALVELRSYADTRAVFDQVFFIRERTCEDPGAAGKVGSAEIYCPTPDSPHWATLFGGEVTAEYGKKTAEIFEEIIKIGLPQDQAFMQRVGIEPLPTELRTLVRPDVYANGFTNAETFATWLDHLLKKADGRMDVVWQAWKLALSLEVVDTLGVTTVENKSDNRVAPNGDRLPNRHKYVLATPPLGNSLFTFINHLKIKRRLELGLYTDGSRASTEKFISHSGLPVSIEHIPDLCSDYLHQAEIELDLRGLNGAGIVLQDFLNRLPQAGMIDFDDKRHEKLRSKLIAMRDNPEGDRRVKISLWDLWLYGKISFADPKFPWFQTDQPSADSTPGELEPGSFGFWLLTRSRSFSILEDIRSQPAIKDLSSPDFFVKRLRNWTKVLGNIDAEKNPQDNPRMWWTMGLLEYHLGGLLNHGAVKRDSNEDFRDRSVGESMDRSREGGTGGEKSVTIGDFLSRATECGFLRQADANFIANYLQFKLIL